MVAFNPSLNRIELDIYRTAMTGRFLENSFPVPLQFPSSLCWYFPLITVRFIFGWELFPFSLWIQRVMNDLKTSKLSRGRMIWLLPHPLPLLRHTGRLRKKDNLLTGQGEGSGRGAESYDGKKSWSSINHSILSALSPPNHPPLSLSISPISQADVFPTTKRSHILHLSTYSRFYAVARIGSTPSDPMLNTPKAELNLPN